MTVTLALFLAWGVLVSPASTDPAPPPDSTLYQFDNEKSSMTIYGSSNVRDWTMDVEEINGQVNLGATNEAGPTIQSVEVEIPIQNIVSDKDRLQNHAHEALKKEEHPTITFTSSDVTVSEAPADSFSVSANGDLTIAGETKAVQLTAKGSEGNDDSLTVRGEYELQMSTFNVERPSLMFGAIKVTDPIRIAFDVVLIPQQASPATAP